MKLCFEKTKLWWETSESVLVSQWCPRTKHFNSKFKDNHWKLMGPYKTSFNLSIWFSIIGVTDQEHKCVTILAGHGEVLDDGFYHPIFSRHPKHMRHSGSSRYHSSGALPRHLKLQQCKCSMQPESEPLIYKCVFSAFWTVVFPHVSWSVTLSAKN